MSEYSGPEEELKPHRRRAVGTVTATTSGTLLATRADLEDKQVTTLVVSAGSGIGTRGGAIRECGPASRRVTWSKSLEIHLR